MSKTCGTCDAYLVLGSTGGKQGEGICRARPPSVIVAGLSAEKLPVIQSAFPPMASFGWCREHRDRVVLNKMDPAQLGNIPAEGSA